MRADRLAAHVHVPTPDQGSGEAAPSCGLLYVQQLHSELDVSAASVEPTTRPRLRHEDASLLAECKVHRLIGDPLETRDVLVGGAVDVAVLVVLGAVDARDRHNH